MHSTATVCPLSTKREIPVHIIVIVSHPELLFPSLPSSSLLPITPMPFSFQSEQACFSSSPTKKKEPFRQLDNNPVKQIDIMILVKQIMKGHGFSVTTYWVVDRNGISSIFSGWKVKSSNIYSFNWASRLKADRNKQKNDSLISHSQRASKNLVNKRSKCIIWERIQLTSGPFSKKKSSCKAKHI